MEKFNFERKCPVCGEVKSIYVDEKALVEWLSGEKLIQDAFPEMTLNEREMLLSGICSSCYEKFMKDPDEEEEDDEILHKIKEASFDQLVKSQEFTDDEILEEMVSFNFEGINIVCPWFDGSVRFLLSNNQAIEEYGEENYNGFIEKMKTKLAL